MDAATVRDERLRSHRLSAPAPTVAHAAAHMLATQSQEFWGGRWALACRTAGSPTVRDVDAAFDRGEIVRSWTMRGTIHVLAAADLGWLLSVTGERQLHQAAAVHRREGIDDDEIARAERAVRRALAGRNRLTRAELFAALEASRISTAGQRGYHALVNLSLRGVVCQGPVVPRESGPAREQYLVLADEWIRDAAAPADPLGELYARYIASHGPAGTRDFAWWSGLPLGVARDAAQRATAHRRVEAVHDELEPQRTAPERRVAPERRGAPEPWHIARDRPVASGPPAPDVVALPPFDEYYLSYADRTVACAPELLSAIGPSRNGMVRPIIVAGGDVIGVWRHSVAVGRHTGDPVPELLVRDAASDDDISAALDRYRAFITA